MNLCNFGYRYKGIFDAFSKVNASQISHTDAMPDRCKAPSSSGIYVANNPRRN